METTSEQCAELFTSAPMAAWSYKRWLDNPFYRHVTPRIRSHVSRHIYQVTPDEVLDAAARGGHALGDVKRKDAESLLAVANWAPAFTFTYLFQHLLEEALCVPSWEDYRGFIWEDPEGLEMMGKPVRDLMTELEHRRVPYRLAADAVRWRFGCAYYGFMRELYTFSALRQEGVPIQTHPMADSVFKADGWYGRTVLAVYIGNSTYRNGAEGRKIRTEIMLRQSPEPFRVLDVSLKTVATRGVLHVPHLDDIKALAASL